MTDYTSKKYRKRMKVKSWLASKKALKQAIRRKNKRIVPGNEARRSVPNYEKPGKILAYKTFISNDVNKIFSYPDMTSSSKNPYMVYCIWWNGRLYARSE